jgi:hypothetical protein
MRIPISRSFEILLVGLIFCVGASIAQSQSRQEVSYDFSQNQFTALYQRTSDDYSLQNANGSSTRVELNGVAAEYSWRHYYPFEIIGRVSYSLGQPLGQKLMTFTSGAGYTRQIHRRYFPFARITGGMAHTSSSDQQYLQPSMTGFALNLDGGLDINIGDQSRWGVRAVEFQNQYLPFGVHNLGSVYWSFGAGAYIRFGK